MNVLFLLGNGFDLQLGLKTRYEHFYEYYNRQPSSSQLVVDVKHCINGYLNGKADDLPSVNWADLELALGQYTSVIDSYEQLRTVFLDINTELMKYLKQQERMFTRDETILSKLRQDFCTPENYLSINQKRKYCNLIDGTTILSILTLNYTHFPKFVFEKKSLPNNSNGASTNFTGITHIHGDLDMQNVLLGVNDVSQIANESLRELLPCQRMLIKPSANDMVDNQRIAHMRSLINNAKVIVIYGASLGDSDLLWRELLKKKLQALNTYFFIVEYKDGFSNLWDQTYEEDIARETFIRKLGIEEVENCQNFVFVAVTRKMFDIRNLPKNMS